MRRVLEKSLALLFAAAVLALVLLQISMLVYNQHPSASFETAAAAACVRRAFVVEKRKPVYSLINDETLDWDVTVHREWLTNSTSWNHSKRPQAMLLLTDFGWNHENQTYGKQVFRNIRSTELYNGIINHVHFHPTAWRDSSEGRMELLSEVRYYVFLDKHSCGEKNYPIYGKGMDGIMLNRDSSHNRGSCCLDHKNHFISEIMASKIMSSPNAIFVLFECSGVGPKKKVFRKDRIQYPGNKLAFISISALTGDLIPNHDQGLVPPALVTCRDSFVPPHEDDCNNPQRPILFSFAGKLASSKVRQDLELLNNDETILVGGHEKPRLWMMMNATTGNSSASAYLQMASKSIFGLVPRGDNLFSYRLTEIMSCGAIPVIFADDWKLPFGDRLIDWTSVAIIIPEQQANNTVQILSTISWQTICDMKRRVRHVYDKYMRNGQCVINGIIENFELTAKNEYNNEIGIN